MRVWRYMFIVAALALMGCEEANNDIPDNGDGNNTGMRRLRSLYLVWSSSISAGTTSRPR